MKKMSFAFTFLVLGALVLAACGGGASNNESGTPGAVGTAGAGVGTAAPSMDLTGTPAAGTGTDLGTPTVDTGAAGAATVAPTTGAGGMATAAPTTGAAGGATAEPTTSTGSIPSTGSGAQFVLLSDLMKMNINSQDGMQIGSVAGVVVDRGASASSSSGSSTSGSSTSGSTSGSTTGTAMPSSATAAPTTAASGSGSATAEPTMASGGSTSGSTSGSTAMGAGPRVSFLLVNVNTASGSSKSGSTSGSTSGTAVPTTSAGGSATAMPTTGAGDSTGSGTAGSGTTGSSASGASGSQVLVPWQAFTVSGGSASSMGTGSTSGSTSGSTTGTAIPTTSASGSATAMPTTSASGSGSTAGSSMSSQTLTLNVSQSVLSGAPAFDASAFKGSVSSDAMAYWSGQNLSIPATGASSANNAVLIRGQVGSLSVKDQGGKSLGQVRDFVVDTMTGELRYAVLSGGSASSGSMYIVPVSALSWQAGMGTSGADLGTFNATFDSSRLSSAPSVSSLSDLNLSSTDWNSKYDTYWNTTP